LTSTSSRPNRPRGRGGDSYRPRELREQRVSPDKSLGQHFLTDWSIVKRIVEAAAPDGLEALIEVGPGLGALTDRLLETAPRLIAVEMDATLAARLRERHAAATNLTVIEADALTTSPAQLLTTAGLPPDALYGFVSNLPYNAGAAIIRHFLEAEHPPRWLVVMLQREVAESIVAAPGDLGLLGVSVQVYARARRLFNVPPRAFYPPPKVTSTVIRLDVLEEPLITHADRASFFETVRAGFSAPRKTVRNSLANGLNIPGAEAEALLTAAHLDPTVRPAVLQVEDWVLLSRQRAAGEAPRSPSPKSERGLGGEV
jgi:16S rRNA (adenine1518-N6/adenine1519-N6)-dimethyltransferase